ncbi:MAG: biopolymer transporter ExbD [Planctomyces sp.]|nr:biopolymer transporter ExbD [Planctomyces sp.]
MAARSTTRPGYTRIDVPMTPMIDVVFQLLIFFMLTLKIIAPEGDFSVNMPIAASGEAAASAVQPLQVRLIANPDGSLGQLMLGEQNLGNRSPDCFRRLNREIGDIVSQSREFIDDLEVIIDSDYGLHYSHLLKAVSHCRGRMQGGQFIPFIKNIRFAEPRPPEL